MQYLDDESSGQPQPTQCPLVEKNPNGFWLSPMMAFLLASSEVNR
jgi:hypothetical protein